MIRATIAVAVFLTNLATAATIQVSPGSGTLQAAIDSAAPGDRLVLAEGSYDSAVVDVPGLRITGSDVDIGVLGGAVGLTIHADAVRIDGPPPVSGGDPRFRVEGTMVGVLIENVDGVRLQRVKAGFRTISETGLLVRASTRVTLSKIMAEGTTYPLHLIALPAGSRTTIRNSALVSFGTAVSMALVEDCAPGAGPGGAKIKFKRILSSDSFSGPSNFVLRNCDGIEVSRSGLLGEFDAVTIDLDATSDNNTFTRNQIDPCTIQDAGSGNVFLRNYVVRNTLLCP
jgi:hypothetical protein